MIFEELDWSDVIARYDSSGALFYLDPPYFGSEGDYGDQFGRDQFEKMATQLRGLRGKFILSINDVPEIRKLFDWAVLDEVRLSYTVSRQSSGGKASELLVSNFEAKEGLL